MKTAATSAFFFFLTHSSEANNEITYVYVLLRHMLFGELRKFLEFRYDFLFLIAVCKVDQCCEHAVENRLLLGLQHSETALSQLTDTHASLSFFL